MKTDYEMRDELMREKSPELHKFFGGLIYAIMAFEDAVQQRTYVLEKRFDDDFDNSAFPTYAECDAVANAAIDKIIAETIEIAVRGNLAAAIVRRLKNENRGLRLATTRSAVAS